MVRFHGKVLWRAAAVLCGSSCRGAGRGGDSKERLEVPLDLPRSSILDALDAFVCCLRQNLSVFSCRGKGRSFDVCFLIRELFPFQTFLSGLSTLATRQRDGPFLKARVSVVEVYHTKPTSALESGAEGWGSDNWPWQIPWLPHRRKKAPLLCKDPRRIVLIRSCSVWNVMQLIRVDL